MAAQVLDRIATEVREKIARHGEADRRRRTATALEQHPEPSQFYAAAVESSSHAFFTVDLDGVITAWNHGAGRLFGFTADDAVGRHVSLIVPENRRHEVATVLDSMRNGQPIDNSETVRIGHDGTLIDVALGITPVKFPSGARVASFPSSTDVPPRSRPRKVSLGGRGLPDQHDYD